MQPFVGAGLGLRRALIDSLLDQLPKNIDFLEVAPENWINVGGRYGKQFEQLAEKYPISLHGLSLNIGGFSPLDGDLIQSIKEFMRRFDCPLYSEHLSACGDDGHLYDLMPIPFTDDAITIVAGRIRQVQDMLEQRIAVENVSYYAAPYQHMSESVFINAVLEEADCDLLLDVNNIYVNSINHGYDAKEFLLSLPAERVKYMHVAGHFDEAKDLRVDTHGSDVIPDVWQLLDVAYQNCGIKPTLLERDFNFPPLEILLKEVDQVRQFQEKHTKLQRVL